MLVADAAYGAGEMALAERLARAAAEAARDPTLLCEALSVLGRSTFAADPAASDAALRRVAQIAAEHGLVPWRVQALFGLGSHEHTPVTWSRRRWPPRASWRWRRACSSPSCRRTWCAPTQSCS